jgi:glycosyltransferase involved in cell wall biosynthesis
MTRNRLSVVLATRNEEKNIRDCLESVKDIADEIIVVDEKSQDRTSEIAKSLGARVYQVPHEPIFHKTKQKALDLATGDWILQLDADERVTPELAKEISEVNNMSQAALQEKRVENARKRRLFERHQRILEERDGKIGTDSGETVAFFIPRRNIFLGKPLIHAGVYPDASIRLIKKGKARFPAKSVHEIMQPEGRAGWLENDLEHHDSPTFTRYLNRANRYTELTAKEFSESKIPLNIFGLLYFVTVKPTLVFFKLYLRHLGFLDGMRGFIWSFFSALHFPIAYFKYWQKEKK